MCNALRIKSLRLQVVRDWLNDSAASLVTMCRVMPAASLGITERILEKYPFGWVREVRKLEHVDALHRAGEVGVNLDPLRVARDEERRFSSMSAYFLSCSTPAFKSLPGAFVFPGEGALLPNVGPTVTADRRLGRPSQRSRRRRAGPPPPRLLAEQRTQIQEMLLRPADRL